MKCADRIIEDPGRYPMEMLIIGILTAAAAAAAAKATTLKPAPIPVKKKD